MTAMADKIAELLRPHLEGCDWEWNIDETPRALWRLNGIDPPPSECLPSSSKFWRAAADRCTDGSDAEKRWVETNKAEEWEGTGKL